MIVSACPAAEPAPGATVVDATGCLVLPGLVDTHRHTWQSALRDSGRADLIVVAADTPAVAPVLDPHTAVVLAGHPGLVRTVVCDGVVVKRDGVLTGPVRRAMDAAAESLAHLRRAAPGVLGA